MSNVMSKLHLTYWQFMVTLAHFALSHSHRNQGKCEARSWENKGRLYPQDLRAGNIKLLLLHFILFFTLPASHCLSSLLPEAANSFI